MANLFLLLFFLMGRRPGGYRAQCFFTVKVVYLETRADGLQRFRCPGGCVLKSGNADAVFEVRE